MASRVFAMGLAAVLFAGCSNSSELGVDENGSIVVDISVPGTGEPDEGGDPRGAGSLLPATTLPPPSTQAAPPSLRNAAIPALCGHPGGTLVDGSLPLVAGAGGGDPGFVTLTQEVTGDVDGDGRPDVAGLFRCSAGGDAFPEVIVVFRHDLSVLGVVDTGDDRVMLSSGIWRSSVAITYAFGSFLAGVDLEFTAVDPTTHRDLRIGVNGSGALVTEVVPQVPYARCVAGELYFGMRGHRDEIVLYQRVLAERGYDPGDLDGYFGERTLYAGTQESLDHAPDVGLELFPDDGVVMRPAFERLGIAC